MTRPRGPECHSARLSEADVIEMRMLAASGVKLADLAAAYPQCSKPNIHHIINGRRWQYLLPATAAARPQRGEAGR